MRMRYLLSHMRWHGSGCLGILFRLHLQLLLQDRGILQWLWLHGWLMCFMDAPCVLLVRNLGPCLQAAGISYYFFGLGVR